MYSELEDKTQSPLERRFLEDCVSVGLHVIPQFQVGRIHADFGIPEQKIVVECDARQWHKDLARDEWRDSIYNAHGFTVIRIPGFAVHRWGEEIAADIKRGVFDGHPRAVVICNYGDSDDYGEE